MLIFVLLIENFLVVLFWTFFQTSRQPQRIRKERNHQNFCWCRGIFYLSNATFTHAGL